MSSSRRDIYFNDAWQKWHSGPASSTELVRDFHRGLPDYKETPLVKLDELATEIGVRAIYLKDEGSRFGLPSFKILGASWGTFRAITSRLGLALDCDMNAVKASLPGQNISLYAATDGNHGRAVARMGAWLGLSVEIHVPAGMHQTTIGFIESEGAGVVKSSGDYDTAVLDAQAASQKEGGILVQDFAFGDYVDVPQWIVDGYGTMMSEIEDQLVDHTATHVLAPVGVGSFAQAVTSYFRREESSTRVISVEPDTAACLWKSLKAGCSSAIETIPTIMAGLDCGTVSTTAWPILSKGLAASLTVSDFEAHSASLYLKSEGISAGPCSGSTVAALRRLTSADKSRLGIDANSVIVLPCTEGARAYDVPLDVAIDDPVLLTQKLAQINSANPSMGSVPGPGETVIARYIAAWFEHRDLECHWIEPTKGRPSVVGVMRGTGGGKSLMFNGHIDTVTLVGYDGDPLSGNIQDGKLYGRGAADMKCGVAAAMVALANSRHLGLRGDVIFAGVADEEDLSIGTEDVLRAGWRADGAIVNEPTNLCIVNAHKGFVWLDVTIYGIAAHGSRADLGVDAISKSGHFLAELDRYSQQLRSLDSGSLASTPTIHASLIKGGEEASSYPAACCVTLECRTLAGQTASSVEREIREMLVKIQKNVADFSFDVKAKAERPAFEISRDDPFCQLVREEVGAAMGTSPTVCTEPYWTDCALLAAEGIPSLLWGPIGEGLHAKEEWADVKSIKTVTSALTSVAAKFCK